MKVQPQKGAILPIKQPVGQPRVIEQVLAELDRLKELILSIENPTQEPTTNLVGHKQQAQTWTMNLPTSIASILKYQPESQNDILAPVWASAQEIKRGRGTTTTFKLDFEQRMAMLHALEATQQRMSHRDLIRAIDELRVS